MAGMSSGIRVPVDSGAILAPVTAKSGQRRHARKGRAPMRPPGDFVERLLAGQSYQVMSDEYGVHRNTIATWADLPEIRDELARLRRERQQRSLQQLEALQAPALTTMTELLAETAPLLCERCKVGSAMCSECGKPIEAPSTPPAVRAKVSEMVLDRTGLPKREVHEHAGSIGQPAPTPAADADILDEAAAIAADCGEALLAIQNRALAAKLRARVVNQEKSA